MSLYVLGDPHLSLGSEKPMDIFSGWDGYVSLLEENWKKTVQPQDTILLAGDISWALKLEETKADFDFLEALPGKKILLKGNHDLWWSTKSKVERFWTQQGYTSFSLLFNIHGAAGMLICSEAGGRVTTVEGGSPPLTSPCGVLASNSALHSQILALLEG